MAPSQRGLGMMMKRGRKGCSALPNAACAHINIEHVGVISCEPRQLASEVPLRKTVGLVEAPLGSAWSAALDKADCKQLMKLLVQSPCQVVQKGKGRFTVLHAAAMRGCLKLLDQVFEIFQGKDCRFVNEREGIVLSLQELCKAEGIYSRRNEDIIGATGLTAAEFAWWSMGECKARKYLNKGAWRERFSSYQSEIFGSSMYSEGDDEENPSPSMLLYQVLVNHSSLLTVRMRSAFEEDLDYNFVNDCEELRFHHACQYLYKKEFLDYVEAVIWGCVEKGPHVLKYLFQLRNAQGQTPLHVALKYVGVYYSSCCHLVRLIPVQVSGEILPECLDMPDSRGWTVLHCCASLQDLSYDLDELLKDGRANVNARVAPMSGRSGESPRATPLHLAVIHNNWEAVEKLLQDPRTNVNDLSHREIYFDDNLFVSRLVII